MATTRVGIFNVIDPPTPQDLEYVYEAQHALTFPMERFLPDLRERGANGINVAWYLNAGKTGADWFSPYIRLFDRSVLTPTRIPHEVGHAFHEYLMTPSVQTSLTDLLHDRVAQPPPPGYNHGNDTWSPTNDYFWSLREAFAECFSYAFAPSVYPYNPDQPDFGHFTTRWDTFRSTCLSIPVQTFPDVSVNNPDIDWLAENGITSGDANGNFNPASPVTRAQLAAFLHRYDRLRHPTE